MSSSVARYQVIGRPVGEVGIVNLYENDPLAAAGLMVRLTSGGWRDVMIKDRWSYPEL